MEIGRDPATGKRRYKTGTAKTKREADALVRRLLRDAETESANTERATTARTLGELIERWLEVGGPGAPSTRLVHAGYIKRQIKPHIAGIRLDRLKVTDLDEWYVKLRSAGLQPSSIRKAHNIVRGALSQGLRWGWVQVNVAAMSKPPALSKPVIATPRAAQVKELVTFIAAVDRERCTVS